MPPDLSPTAQLLADLHSLTPRERLRLAGYAGLIFAPLIAAFLGWLRFGPTIEQVLK